MTYPIIDIIRCPSDDPDFCHLIFIPRDFRPADRHSLVGSNIFLTRPDGLSSSQYVLDTRDHGTTVSMKVVGWPGWSPQVDEGWEMVVGDDVDHEALEETRS